MEVIKGTMSNSSLITGSMSKEFSAVRCLDFNGSSDFVELPAGYDLTQFSIECWIRTLSVNSTWVVHIYGGSSVAYIQLRTAIPFQPPYNATFTYNIKSDANEDRSSKGTKIINDDKWHQLIIVSDETDIKTYVDNVADNYYERYSVSPITCSDGGIYFAALTASYGWYKKHLCNIRIYNKALDDTERQNNFNGKITQDGLVGQWLFREQSGVTLHDSVSSNDGTITGADWREEKFNTPLKGIMSNSSKITGTMSVEYT